MTTKSAERQRMMALFIQRLGERLAHFEAELAWARDLAPPPDSKPRPAWLKRVILLLAEVNEIEGLPLKQPPTTVSPSALGELAGRITAFEVLLNHPSAATIEEEKQVPPLKQLRKAISEVGRNQCKMVSRLLPKLPVGGAGDLSENVAQYYQGTADGIRKTNTDSATLTDEIFMWLWLFWPEADTAKSREELHRWFTEMKFVSCSFKLIEKVCRKIGFRSQGKASLKNQPTRRKTRVGRPRK